MKKNAKILITGALGQLGTELSAALRTLYGNEAVVATDILAERRLDVLDKAALYELVRQEKITEIYHLAAFLSASGEQYPQKARQLNMEGLINVLDAARLHQCRVFWPSSIAVFGPSSPQVFCPQHTVLEPNTVYGITKAAGELWCKYYHEHHDLDVRSLRYPGLISHSAQPGGGTTDYAVAIFHDAFQPGGYTCYLKPDTQLPMMYMPDAVRATIELMNAPTEKIRTRTSYNLQALSFTPQELAKKISERLPAFRISYQPDFRQQIAEGWPGSIDDRQARHDWGWKPAYDLDALCDDMLKNLKPKNKHVLS